AGADWQWAAPPRQSAVHCCQGGGDDLDRTTLHREAAVADADRLVCLELRHRHALERGGDRPRAWFLALAAWAAVEGARAAAAGGAMAQAGGRAPGRGGPPAGRR